MKWTVFFDQINRTNVQVTAKTADEAEAKAEKLYRKHFSIPTASVEEGWLEEADGEDE